jgi:hypothetical protein
VSQPNFEDRCIISCGMLRPEISYLVETGFLNPKQMVFAPPGLHALPHKLEEHLLKRIARVQGTCPPDKTIVAYGKKCHVDADDPLKRVDSILQGAGQGLVRVQGDYGYDMLADYEERQRISGGRQDNTLWFTLGWLIHWKLVYQRYFGWDRADANANFPGYYDRIIVLDGLGLADAYMAEHAEEVLDLFDWTGLEVEFHPITLDRFKGLLQDALLATAPGDTSSTMTREPAAYAVGSSSGTSQVPR